jgi:hypothetical protein
VKADAFSSEQVEKLFRTDIQTIKNFCKLAQPEHLPALNEIERQFMTEFDYVRCVRRRHRPNNAGGQP